MTRHPLISAACASLLALGGSAVLAQADSARPAATAKSAKAAAAPQAVTTATGTAKPAKAQQSKAPDAAAKAEDSWKSNCHHGKDSDA